MSQVKPSQVVSLGLVNGRNIWINNLAKSVETVQQAVALLGSDRVFVAPSCSMLHSPHSLEAEVKMDSTLKAWMAFAVQKLDELVTIAKAVSNDKSTVQAKLDANAAAIASRATSPLIHDPNVKSEMAAVTADHLKRRSPFSTRNIVQQERLQLPNPMVLDVSSPQLFSVMSLAPKP